MAKETKKEIQSKKTRQKLIEIAHHEFSEHGYELASTDEVVKKASLTRGALYHHFHDKRALFLAVFEKCEEELLAEIEKNTESLQKPLEKIFKAVEVFLDTCIKPGIHRIVLIDGPVVLGWDMWRLIDAQYSFGFFKENLAKAMENGDIQETHILPLTHCFIGSLNEAALVIAEAPKRNDIKKDMISCIQMLLKGLQNKKSFSLF